VVLEGPRAVSRGDYSRGRVPSRDEGPESGLGGIGETGRREI
jgi:hypothetical protein